jgi:hypothetical protein
VSGTGRGVRALAVAVLVAAGVLVTPAASAHPGETAIDITPAEATAGDTVQVSGEGFTTGAQVDVVLLSAAGDQVLATPTVDDEGHFRVDVALPDDLTTRYYEVQAVGADATVSELVQVAEAGGSGLAQGELVLLLASGGVLLGVAGIAVLLRRRTRVSV